MVTRRFKSYLRYMKNPVKGLHPLKKITWTLWNLDSNGNISTWLGTTGVKSSKDVIRDTDGEWITVSADVDALDNCWGDKFMHGIAMYSSSGKPFILYTPNVNNVFVNKK